MTNYSGYDLMLAVREGNDNDVSALIATCGLSHFDAASNGYTFLCEALERNHTKIAKILLEHGSTVNLKDTSRMDTPLHFAVKNNDAEIVAMLLDRSANVNATNNPGETPLHLSIKGNNLKIVSVLLNKNAEVNAQGNYGKTCFDKNVHEKGCTLLHTAAINKKLDIAEMLIKHGANVNAIDETGNSPIFYAIEKVDAKMTKLLVFNGAEIKFHPDVLQRGVNRDSKEIIELMLNHDVDCDIMAKDNYGQTALGHVIAYVNLENNENSKDLSRIKQDLAELLLSRGAKVDAKNEAGESLLHIVARNGGDDVVEILLRYNADVNFATKISGETPLHYSATEGNEPISRMLLNAGAASNAKDIVGKTPLHYACKHESNKKVVDTLLKFEAEIDHKDNDDCTPLHIAAGNGCRKIVETLLKSFADVECTDKDGNTALHVATKCGWPKVVKVLLDYGARLNVTCKKFYSPFDYSTVELYHYNKARNSHLERQEFDYNIDDEYRYNYCYDEYSDSDQEDHHEYYDNFDGNAKFRSDHRSPGRISYMIWEHIIKIRSLIIQDSERNLESVELNDEFERFQAKCEREVELMKSERIGETNISYYDVLLKSINRLAILTRNKDVVEDLESSRCGKKFPTYYKMLYYKFKKGQKRGNLLIPSLKSFNFLTRFPLPELASLKVLDELTVKELENLIKAASET